MTCKNCRYEFYWSTLTKYTGNNNPINTKPTITNILLSNNPTAIYESAYIDDELSRKNIVDKTHTQCNTILSSVRTTSNNTNTSSSRNKCTIM
jgi:hypothetical protein